MQRYIRDGERVGERRTAADWDALHPENKALHCAKDRCVVPSATSTVPRAVPFRAAFREWCALAPAEKGAYTVPSENDFFDAVNLERRRDNPLYGSPSKRARDVEGLTYARTHARGFALMCCERDRDLHWDGSRARERRVQPICSCDVFAWRDLTRDQQRDLAQRVPDVSAAMFERLSRTTPGREREPLAPTAFAVYVASPARRDNAARLIQREFITRVFMNPRAPRSRERLVEEATRAIRELASHSKKTHVESNPKP